MNPFRSLRHSPSTEHASDAVAAPAKSPQDARNAIVDLLKLEGCQPSIDSDRDIVFKFKDFTYVMIFSRKDPEYIRLVLPNFWEIDSDSERIAAYAAANTTNCTCQAAKIMVEDKQTHAAIQCFLAAPEQIVPVLLRSASALAYAAQTFRIACTLQRRQ